MKLLKTIKKKNLIVKFVRRHIQAEVGFFIITEQNMMNPTLTSATFAWRFLLVNRNLLFTQEFIQVRNLLCVLLVARDLLKKFNYKLTKQLTVRKENIDVPSVMRENSLKQKLGWVNTWSIILIQNTYVNSVERNIINHQI